MAHHKRRRRKDARAGCLMCKPHKGNGMKRSASGRTHKQNIDRVRVRDQLAEVQGLG